MSSNTMHAIQIEQDDARSLTWQKTSRPTPKEDQVLVKIHAAALNRADLLQRKGLYPPPKGASEIMGLEAAGEIVSCGEAVENWSEGDRVCVLLEGGGYAEYVACDASMLLPIPKGFSWQQAAALPEVFYTAFLNLKMEGDLKDGERVLVHAGASGVGTAVIQLCKAWGNPVIATTSTQKVTRLQELGATQVFDRHTPDFFKAIREFTEGIEDGSEGRNRRGVDLIFDPVGASYLEENISLLRLKGRLVLIGLLGGAQANIHLGKMLARRLKLIGSVLRSRSREEKLRITKRIKEEVWPLFEEGVLQPIIHSTFPMKDAEAAHKLMASNQTIGKIILEVSH